MTNRDVYACLFVGEGVLRAATERRHEATGILPRMSVSGHVRCCTTPDHKVVMQITEIGVEWSSWLIRQHVSG
jgi:hypothetical protein